MVTHFFPEELVKGDHELLDRPYSPMTVRFFMLQSHYSSTLDFSNDALWAAQKGYKKLANGLRIVKIMEYVNDGETIDEGLAAQLLNTIDACGFAMNDNFNTALTIAQLFNLLKRINSINTGNLKYSVLGEEIFYKNEIDLYRLYGKHIRPDRGRT